MYKMMKVGTELCEKVAKRIIKLIMSGVVGSAKTSNK